MVRMKRIFILLGVFFIFCISSVATVSACGPGPSENMPTNETTEKDNAIDDPLEPEKILESTPSHIPHPPGHPLGPNIPPGSTL